MLPPVELTPVKSSWFSPRDKAFIDKLKSQGYSESAQYDLLNKARAKNGLQPIQWPATTPWTLWGMFWQAKEIAGQAWTGLKKAGSDIMDITDGSIDKPREEQGVIGKSISDIQKRASNLEKISSDMWLKNPWYFEQKRMQLRWTGQLAGAASDVFGNIFSGAIETVVPKSLREQTGEVAGIVGRTELGQDVKWVAQTAFQKYQQFKQNNPELAADVEAGGNIANFALNFVWVGWAGAIASKGDDFVRWVKSELETIVKQSAPKVAEMAGKTGWIASKVWTGATEVWISTASGISREAQQAIKSTPELYQSARTGAMSREWITWEVTTALDKRMNDLSDLWKGYESVRNSTIRVPRREIESIVWKYLKGKNIDLIDLPTWDRTVLKNAANYIMEYGETMTAKNALSLRKKLDDLINWKSEATTEWKRLVRWMRAKVDEYLGQKLPWLKALDKKYAPEREFIDKVRWLVYDKQGNMKDTAISSIANITWKGKELKLDRLEKLIPWIGDKVRALQAFEEIKNISQIKTGAAARQLFSLAIGGIPLFVATHPYVVGFALEKYGFGKQYIKNLLSKGKNISKEEMDNVKKAIVKMPKKEAEKVISQWGKNLLTEWPTPTGKVNWQGQLPPTDLTPNASNSVAWGTSKSVPSNALNTSVPSLPAPKISTTATPTRKKVVSPSKKLKTNKDIIQKKTNKSK